MVLVPQLCRGLGIFMYTAVLVNTPGGGSRMRAV